MQTNEFYASLVIWLKHHLLIALIDEQLLTRISDASLSYLSYATKKAIII